ncbi:MAG: beta-lactamase family protein [Opitutaceae bacterium]|nr:beta-lactamase family protein [Opitutaceae bacterium]
MKTTALTLALALTLAVTARVLAAEPAAVDAVFARFTRPGSPGASLVVIRDGRIVYERGYGHATLTPARPVTPETSFYIGSVSKQFTAAAIALLHQRGQVGLDDDVRRYVPELPDYGRTITVRHCVHHTSGLRDYLALRDLAGADPNATFGDAEVLALLRRQKGLGFEPGARHSYSNSGYFILSLIVRRVTGQSLRDFAAANLFGPLGMTTAQFRDRHTQPIPHRADGYKPAGAGFALDNPNFDVVGAGGVFMTARDFLAWDQNFYSAKVGGPAFIALLQTPGTLDDGTRLDYAFGLRVGRYRGLDLVEHSGAYGGFRAHVIRFPAQRFSVVCFTNLSTALPARLVRQVADLYLADALTGPAAAPEAAPAAPPSPRRATAPRGPVDLAAYVGDYRSDELDVTYGITAGRNPGELLLRPHRRPPMNLVPAEGEAFTATAPGHSLQLTFQRGADGRVTGFTSVAGRAPGLVFERQ